MNSTGKFRSKLRSMGLGPIALRYFHDPKNYISWLIQHNHGHIYRSFRGESDMRQAARRLPTVSNPSNAPGLEVSFMTGRRFWYQTAFCAHSLAWHLQGAVAPVFFDDGSLEPEHSAVLQRIFPTARVVTATESRAALERKLPPSKFPLLHATCRRSPMLRKLVYVRIWKPRWQLYLDSDMFFLARPSLLEQCSAQQTPCYMQDPVPGYCMDRAEMARLAGVDPLPNVNAGIVGLDNETIDWGIIERWLDEAGPITRLHRLFEQTITSMLLSQQRCTALPLDDYTIVANPASQFPATVVLHYIQHAKWPYLAREWRRYLAAIETATPDNAPPSTPLP